ncbi:MAG: helix-turn-helix domain-containing protein [Solirubrobacteraceae bacterium]
MTFGERFYSVAELADVTGYHRDSIYRAIDSGALVAAKPRGKWLIAGAAIDAWLHAGRLPIAESQATVASAPAPARSPAPAPARGASEIRRTSSGARGSFRERARRSRAMKR